MAKGNDDSQHIMLGKDLLQHFTSLCLLSLQPNHPIYLVKCVFCLTTEDFTSKFGILGY